jgi:SPX domain protein involved in polyphosphate accumulation
MNAGFQMDQKNKGFDSGRYEVKYVIPRRYVPMILEFIKPFCDLDPNCVGDPPGYVITTLQLDSPSLSLHYAKLWDLVERFKLRVRVYGEPVGSSPVFMEIKAKSRATIVKYRSRIPFDKWGKHLFGNEIIRGINFKDSKEAENFYQFVRLVKEIGARPVMLIRYHRESYFGKNDHYSRLTLDTRLQYQRTSSWDSWGRGRQWFSLDKPLNQTRRHDKELDFSGVVLELKSLHDVPLWIIHLVEAFNLSRQGHCKYSNSMWAESMFCTTPWPPEYEIDLLQYL